MKKFKKLMSVAMAFVMTSALLAGCSVEEKTLMGAFVKSGTITSMESKTNMKFNVAVSGIPAEEQKNLEQSLNLINSMPIEIATKQTMSADKTTSLAQMDLKVMNMEMGSMWSSADAAKGQALTVVKVPQALSAFLPKEMAGKDYIVMDTKEMMNMPEMKEATGKIDYNKLMNASKDLMPKLTAFLTKYMEQYNSGMNLVTDLGAKKITTPAGDVDTHVFEFKLDDASAKALLQYTVTNMLQNKDSILALKDIFVEYLKAAGMTDKDLAELDKSIAEMQTKAPELIKTFGDMMTALKDVKILGQKGIDIKFAVDANGFIISQEGVVDFVLDMAKLNALDKNMGDVKKAVEAKVNTSAAANLPLDKSMENAVFNLGATFSTVNYNINGNSIAITMPETNAKNSMSFVEVMKMIEAAQAPAKPATKPTTPATSAVKITVAKGNTITVGKAQYVAVDSLKSIGAKVKLDTKGLTVEIKGKKVTAQQSGKSLTLNGKKVTLTNAATVIKNKKVYVSVEVLTKAGITVTVK